MKIALDQVLAELLPAGPVPKADELELVELFRQLWPDQTANLQSYRSKPDCGCKTQILQQMAQTPAILHTFLERLKATRGKEFLYSGDTIPPPPVSGGVTIPTNQSMPQPKVYHLAGQVRRIANLPEAYLALITDLRRQGGRYAGLSVLQDGKDLLVFFY